MKVLSKTLFAASVALSLLLFIPVWMNVLVVPIHIGLHSLLVFGLFKTQKFDSSMTATQFAFWISILPVFFYVIFCLGAVLNGTYATSSSGAATDFFLILGYTLLVCVIEFLLSKRQYISWLKKHGI